MKYCKYLLKQHNFSLSLIALGIQSLELPQRHTVILNIKMTQENFFDGRCSTGSPKNVMNSSSPNSPILIGH